MPGRARRIRRRTGKAARSGPTGNGFNVHVMADFIPVNEPVFAGNEKKYLNQCIDTAWVSSEGPFVKSFEEAFAAKTGRRHGIAVSNGTCGLELAVAALGIGPGDEVIIPTFTIISCALAVIRAGARPVLVDCDPETWNMDPAQVEARITPSTKAIMIVHIYGLPADVAPVLSLAQKHGLRVIEDAAEAIGQCYRGRPCGSIGDVSVFSLYANKHVTTGEGGMVATDDAALADRCRSLRNLCFGSARFVHDGLGWNMRMSNIQAALGLAQLERLDFAVERKRRMGGAYTERLKELDCLSLPVPATTYAENVYWVYGVVLSNDVPFDAAEAVRRMAERGVGTRPFFWPMHEQQVLKDLGLFAGEQHPVAENLARRGFYLPSGLALSDDQIQRVADNLRDMLA